MLYFARWKITLILAVVMFGVLTALPNVLSPGVRDAIPSWLPNQTVHLGLDLQGGSHVLLEVDREDLVEQLAGALMGDVRQVLREARVGYTGLTRDGQTVTVRIREPGQVDLAMERLRELSEPVSTGFFDFDQTGTAQNLRVSRDGERIAIRLTDQGVDARVSGAVEQSIEIVRRRIDALGTTEPTITRQGVDRIVVQVPGLDDPERLKELLHTTAVLRFRLLCDVQPDNGARDRTPPGCDLVYSREEPQIPYYVQTSSRATVEGEDLTDAQPAFDARTNEPIVSFRFNQRGAMRFARLTQENVGRPFAIILDGEVISAPVIREPILGGSGQISGNFTVEEANDLAIVLRSGALPAKLVIVEERTVGPSLGADSIRAGSIASVIAIVAVVVFMIATYGLFGIFANLALGAALVLLVGVLSLLQATLTLPGIAGIVLTIGMAVDANVLIFERMREEFRNGRSTINALDAGFSRALSTILDANITTLIAVIILFGLGSGPIRGFAVTLGIGIVTSVFAALMLTRMMIALWTRARKPKTIPI